MTGDHHIPHAQPLTAGFSAGPADRGDEVIGTEWGAGERPTGVRPPIQFLRRTPGDVTPTGRAGVRRKADGGYTGSSTGAWGNTPSGNGPMC